MSRLYEHADGIGGYPENYAEFMISSLQPLLKVYDSASDEPLGTLGDDSYLDKLIEAVAKQRMQSVSATVSAYPPEANLNFEVDGDVYTQAHTFLWVPGSSHAIKANSAHGEYVFDYWSDGGLPEHQVKPTTDMEYVAFYCRADGESFEAVGDATVWNQEPTKNYGNDWMWVQGSNEGYSQVLVRFDLASIPNYAVVQSAELKLHCQSYHGSANLLALSRAMGDWQEFGVTWYTRPSPEDEYVALADFGDTPLYSWKSETYPKLKELVQIWVKGPGVNWGFHLRGSGDGVWFYSGEAAEVSRRPVLVVRYTAAPAGSLNVTLEPREVCDQAKWRLTTGPETNWQKSGATIPAVPVGGYTLEFSDVKGWTSPPARFITIVEGANAESGGYARQVVVPIVTTLPAEEVARNSAELWGRLDDDGGEYCDCGFMYGRSSDSQDTWTFIDCGDYDTDASFSAVVADLECNTEYAYYAVAENEAGISTGNTEIFTATDCPPNHAPVLDPIGDKSVDEGRLLTFSIGATDEDFDALEYAAEPLPVGASFSDQTFVWTPVDGQAGIYEVTFAVSDGEGAYDTETITITVIAEGDPTTLTVHMTVDDDFDFYLSTDDTQLGTHIGSGDPALDHWRQGFTFACTLTPGVTHYLHVVGRDVYGDRAGFVGDFSLSDNSFGFADHTQSLVTDSANWSISNVGFGQSYYTPNAIMTNADGWGGAVIDGISAGAYWIWSDDGYDLGTRYFSSPIVPATP